MERFNVLCIFRPEETKFFLNLIKFEISNVKLECQLDFIVMNFVEQFKQNWKRENFDGIFNYALFHLKKCEQMFVCNHCIDC